MNLLMICICHWKLNIIKNEICHAHMYFDAHKSGQWRV